MLLYFSGLNTAEIAQRLGIKRAAAKKRLQRARDALSVLVFAELGAALEYPKPPEGRAKGILGSVLAVSVSWGLAAAEAATGATSATVAASAGGIAM
jgi:hypothetical protein